jgi:hypothetical protein
MTACPLLWEAVTFLTANRARMTSQICASHIPHIMPLIFTVVSVMVICTPFSIGPAASAAGHP